MDAGIGFLFVALERRSGVTAAVQWVACSVQRWVREGLVGREGLRILTLKPLSGNPSSKHFLNTFSTHPISSLVASES
jgi:hypothetical protein